MVDVGSQWNYREFTISGLEKLIEDCQTRAKLYNVQLYKKGIDGKCFGIVKEGNDVLFKKQYHHRYDFLNTAQIFMDFHFVLEYIARISIRTRNDKNRRFGDFGPHIKLCYNIYGIK